MKTKEEFFQFSNKREKEFNKFYESKEWKYKRIIGKENKDYDCLIEIRDTWYKIEEKSQEKEWPSLLVETIQDTKSNNPGWLYYTKADYLFYENGKDIIYAIDMKKLKGFVDRHKDNFETKYSKKGWGNTEFILIPWYTIIDNKIGKRIK